MFKRWFISRSRCVARPARRASTLEALEPRVLLTAAASNAPVSIVEDVTALPLLIESPGTSQITGVKWLDTNGDGVRQSTEVTLAGTRVYVDQNDNGQLDSTTVVVESTNVPLTLVDLQTVVSNLLVTDVGALLDVDVTVDITHGLVAELDVFLVSPAGTRFELFTDVGSSGANVTNTTLDDEAPTSIRDRRAPYDGRVRPEGSLTALDGENAAGLWSLEIGDDQTGTVGSGTLNHWSLTLTYALEETTLTDVTGTYIFDDIAGGDYIVRELLAPDMGFSQTFPDPLTDAAHRITLADGEVRSNIDFGNQRGGGDIVGTVFNDFNGDGLRQNAESAHAGVVVFLDQNGDHELQTQSASFAATDVPVSIPDRVVGQAMGVPIVSTLTVADFGATLLDVDVTLNITHPFTRDLRVTLISPGGSIVELFDRAGALAPVQQDFIDTTLDDEAATSIRDAAAPFTGHFRPLDPLGAMIGENPSGVWTLEIVDEGTGDVGVLNNWSLTLTAATEPAAITDAAGGFAFTNLTPGEYQVELSLDPSYMRTSNVASAPAPSVHVDAAGVTNVLAGIRGQPSMLTGRYFEDTDGDGQLDANELDRHGVDGVTIELIDRATGGLLATTVTQTEMIEQDLDGDGEPELVPVAGMYRFENVPLGDYDVRQRIAPGDIVTDPVVAFGQPRLTTDVAPNFVANVDVNDDGAADLIVTNRESDSIAVRFNRGDGTFDDGVSYGVGDDPNAVGAGDFDGDGDVDLAVTNGAAGTVSILLNDGTGAFTPGGTFDVGALPNSAAVGDLDGDGDLDVAVVNVLENFETNDNSRQTLSVLLNRGDGTFDDRVRSPAGFFPRGLQLEDLDNDGDLDAAMTSFDDRFVAFVVNDGTGSFTLAAQIDPAAAAQDSGQDIGSLARFVALADFNDDGLADYAATTSQADANGVFATLYVALNNGDLTFTRPRGVLIAREGDFYLTAGDVTGDNQPDIAVTNVDDDSVTVLRNPGDGRFVAQSAVRQIVGRNPVRVSIADLDGDGRGDVSTLSLRDESVTVLLSQPGVHRVVLDSVGDVSDLDFLDFTPSIVGGVAFLDLNKDGEMNASESPLQGVTVRLLDRRQTVVAETLTDADGRYTFANVEPGVYLIEQQTPTGFELVEPAQTEFAPPLVFDTALQPRAVAAADFDGDGDVDLATAARGGDAGGVVTVLVNNGDNRFLDTFDLSVGADPIAIVAADFNGDLRADLAVANASSNTLSVLINQGDGTFLAASHYEAGTLPAAVIAADLDGDGDLDLAIAAYGDDAVTLLFNAGDGTFGGRSTINLTGDDDQARGPIALVASDFDGDSDVDLAAVNFLGNSVSLLLNRGGSSNGVFDLAMSLPTGDRPISAAAGDFDDDGDADLAVAQASFGTIALFENEGQSAFTLIDQLDAGGQPAQLIAADLDADGDIDLAAADTVAQLDPNDPLNGAVAVLLNNGAGVFGNVKRYEAQGTPTAIVATDLDGDHDGDTRLDIVVADRTNNAVGVLLNTAGQHAFRAVSSASFDAFDFALLTDQADLAARYGKIALPTTIVPGDKLRVPVLIANSGAASVRGDVDVHLYLSRDGAIDETDILLDSKTGVAVNLKPGRTRTVTLTAAIDANALPGDYTLLAEIVPEGSIAEFIAINNVRALDQPVHVAWQFGQIDDRRNVRLTLNAFAGGVTGVFDLRGSGVGEVALDNDATALTLTGTDITTRVTIRSDNKTVGLALDDLNVIGSIKNITGKDVDLIGIATFGGNVASLSLRSLQGALAYFVGELGTLTLSGGVTDSRILSGAQLGSDRLPGGSSTAMDAFGPGRIGRVTVKGDFVRSILGAGLDPVDGIFNNGDDGVIGGGFSSLTGLTIGGVLDGESLVAAGALPTKVRISGHSVQVVGDEHFLS